MIYHSPEVIEQFETLGIPVLVEMSSYESEPFGRVGAGQALRRARRQGRTRPRRCSRRKWTAFQAFRALAPTGKTVTFFYVTSNGAVNVRKSTDYVAKSIAMAGGEYVSFDNTGRGERPVHRHHPDGGILQRRARRGCAHLRQHHRRRAYDDRRAFGARNRCSADFKAVQNGERLVPGRRGPFIRNRSN